jgi:hypothetical protein
VDLSEMEQQLRELVLGIPPVGRAELLRVLTIRDDAERARNIGDLHASGVLPTTAELLFDAEEDPHLRAVLVGTLRERSGETVPSLLAEQDEDRRYVARPVVGDTESEPPWLRVISILTG